MLKRYKKIVLLVVALLIAFFIPALGEAQENAQGTVNVNTASVDQLKMLYRVGDVIASRIIEEREANGVYTSQEDFQERVKGIGEKTLACNSSYISLEGETTLSTKIKCEPVTE
jgi:competence protein ComEA